MSDSPSVGANFIRNMIEEDQASGKFGGRVQTRFPPEPNGYLHIGHAKSICLNFGMAQQFDGQCNLRFDDTNPEKESIEYINAIKRDVKWLGFEWTNECYASDYFEKLYDFAIELIEKGLAYVDSQSAETMRAHRGTLTQPGVDSPYRDRSVEENLRLFRAMREGQFADGEHVLRAKIDMASDNYYMRDAVIYRIRHVHHHRTGDAWCIYPLYDFTHGLSDAIEAVTHSLCTLEFEAHRPLYDWFIDHVSTPSRPEQTEFARLQLEYALTSKRKLQTLVDQGIVDGWDDPRMPTLSGMRRRGYPAAAIRDFCERIGVTKKDAWISMGQLEYSVRENLNTNAMRRMAVLEPLALRITNLPEAIEREVPNHPQRPEMGTRTLRLGDRLYIESSDFSLDPPAGFKRLVLGGEVRLRGGYVIRCDEVRQDADGQVIELLCSADLETLGQKPQGRKVKGVIHWVDASDGVDAEIRVLENLITEANTSDLDLASAINPDSMRSYAAKIEADAANASAETVFQFERLGYFAADNQLHQPQAPCFNLTVGLRDTYGV